MHLAVVPEERSPLMKKWLLGILVIACAVVMGALAWRLYGPLHRAIKPVHAPRAMMMDEDAPRKIEPAIGLQVNGERVATVLPGSPVWLTVGIDNAAAVDEVAAAKVLQQRLSHLPAEDPARRRLSSDADARSSPARIAIGDPGHPWTSAVQFRIFDARGERALEWPLRILQSDSESVELDVFNAASATFGVASISADPGAYAIAACLGSTGSWQGKICSEPVQLLVINRPAQLSAQQQVELRSQAARYALLAGDGQLLESSGRDILAADPDSVAGHLYLGESEFRRERWS